jgi:lipopolysaccharide cholinephosphotransferase
MKYKGFIPWDDDLDVGMPREDYEVFLEKAQDMLPGNIFLQNYKTEKNFPQIYSKLRNSNTAFIENGAKHLDINHGIFMDVFPLDGYTENGKSFNSLRKKILSWKIACALNDQSSLKIRIRNTFFRMLGCHKRTQKYLFKKEISIRSSWDGKQQVCNHGDRMHNKGVLPKEYYGEGRTVSFEGIDAVVPYMTEEYLSHKYGAWKAELPIEEQRSHHIAEVCDTETSYRKYIDFSVKKK